MAALALNSFAARAAGQTALPAKPHASTPASTPRQTDDEDDEDNTVSELVVRGKRQQPGAVIGDIKPELQIRPSEIQSFGVSTVTELLDELAPELQSDRGRGGEAPVVLLNGRRISSFNEIRDIPTEAILRIDILPEEVSLKYGYAADQRVVNIVLRPRFRAWTAEGAAGSPTAGGQVQGQGELDLMRIRRDKRLNLDLKATDSSEITEDERTLSPTPTDPTAGEVGQYRTLVPATRSVSANAVLARPIFGDINAAFNATLGATSSTALQGLPMVSLVVPPGNPFAPAAAPVTVDQSLPSLGALRQDVDGWTGHLGATFNRDVAKWRLSLTSAYDHADTFTRTDTSPNASDLQARVDANDPTLDPFAPLSGVITQLGPETTARVRSDGLNAHFVASGPLFPVPAGEASATVSLGDDESWFASASNRNSAGQIIHLSRNDLSGQLNLDLPLASSDKHVLEWLGDLTLNGNLGFDRLSDFGTLTAIGYGMNWSPLDGVTLIVSHTRDEAAPTFQQLGGPIVVTPGVQIFDFTTGRTVAVDEVTGGNPALNSDHRSLTKFGLTWKPLSGQDLTITANYIISRIDNPIVTFPAATAPIEAAFPDRFVRDAEGDLEEVDYRPVNFASETRRDLRWGISYSRPLGPQPQPRAWRRRRPAPQDNAATASGGDGTSASTAGADRQSGQSASQGTDDGEAPRRGGGLGRFARGGRPTPGRLQLAIYHTVYFEDQMLARPGGPLFDLLNGSPLATGGGQPRHEIQAQAGVLLHGFGARVSANWQSGTVVRGDGASMGELGFSPLATVNLRLWSDLGQQRELVLGHPWLRGARVTVSVSNLFDRRLQVHSSTGATPLIYQPDYLDPLGRVAKLTVRKLFF